MNLYIPIYGTRESHGWEFAQATVFDTFEEASEFIDGTKPVHDFTGTGPMLDGHRFIGLQAPDRFILPDEYEDQRNAMEIERKIEREEDARLSAYVAQGWR